MSALGAINTREYHRKCGDIFIICPDKTTFWINSKTLEPHSCGTYDADPWSEKNMEQFAGLKVIGIKR